MITSGQRLQISKKNVSHRFIVYNKSNGLLVMASNLIGYSSWILSLYKAKEKVRK